MSDADPAGALPPPPRRKALPKRAAPRLSRRDIFGSTIGALGVAAGQLSAGWPDSPLRWVLLVGGSVAGGLVARTDTVDFLWDRANAELRKLRPVPLRKTILALAVLILALLSGRVLAAVGPPLVDNVRIELFGCPAAAQLRMLATTEGLQTARELAGGFERASAEANSGCPEAQFYVYAAPPAQARQALAAGWTHEHLKTLGPRPDIWLPGSTSHPLADPLPARLSRVDPHIVASTPVVLAVPKELVGQDIRINREGDPWPVVLATMQERDWGVVRPDPALSLAGELATVAIYRGLAEPPGAPLEPGQARVVERRLEQSLDRAGYPLGDELDLLCRHRRGDPPAGGVIVTEWQLNRFNTGRPLGGTCPVPATPLHLDSLIRLLPAGTAGIDYPAVRLEWTDSASAQSKQAQAFMRWLREPGGGGQAALRDAGLRGPHQSGVLPSDAERQATLAVYQQAKRPGRVLLALDTSGSMRQRLGDGGPTRFELAVAGVNGALAMMSGRDELGLWVFPDVSGRRELVPLQTGESARQQAAAALADVAPTGPTPLYRTIADGVAALSATNGEVVKALVVLTDGEDYGSGMTGSQLVGQVAQAGVRVFIVAVGEASCASQALTEVTEQTGGSCGQTDFAGLERTLSEVFTLLWKGA